jgi:hypothetical protein
MFPANDLFVGAEMAYRRERARPVARRRRRGLREGRLARVNRSGLRAARSATV